MKKEHGEEHEAESRIGHSRSGPRNDSNTSRHVPFPDQRSNRRQAEFRGPKNRRPPPLT